MSGCISANAIDAEQAICVGGLIPLTTIDFPGHLSAVIFTQGCPLRCGYCQNSHLLPAQPESSAPSWQQVLDFLHKRQGVLDGVVISGGEPLIHPWLASMMQQIKALGFKVGLHTAGISARSLAPLLNLLDWVGLDVKAPRQHYARVTGRENLWLQNQRCRQLLLRSGIEFECRTTVDWRLFSPAELMQLAHELSIEGVEQYAVQVNHSRHCLDSRLEVAYIQPDQNLLKRQLSALFPRFTWRD